MAEIVKAYRSDLPLAAEIEAAIQEEYAAYTARRMGSERGYLRIWLQHCESPIEQRLLIALRFADAMCFDQPIICDWKRLLQHHEYQPHEHFWAVVPQHQIGDYRADFLIAIKDDDEAEPRPILVVECDGHEFHDRTKEQAARDRARDRAILAMGFPTMRFTGAEIHRDAAGCADQVGRFVRQLAYGRLREQSV